MFPQAVEKLEQLPGVGSYTARAVAAFAFNQDVILIETNIRTAILHGGMIYHTPSQKVSDAEIAKTLQKVLPKGRAREWYSALMDYGAYLKQSGVKLNAKSKHYTKQSKFAGSNREARGAILRELAKGSQSKTRLIGLLGVDRTTQLRTALDALFAESLIQKRGRVFTLLR
jgi:A/G-specific adenine glycosylase